MTTNRQGCSPPTHPHTQGHTRTMSTKVGSRPSMAPLAPGTSSGKPGWVRTWRRVLVRLCVGVCARARPRGVGVRRCSRDRRGSWPGAHAQGSRPRFCTAGAGHWRGGGGIYAPLKSMGRPERRSQLAVRGGACTRQPGSTRSAPRSQIAPTFEKRGSISAARSSCILVTSHTCVRSAAAQCGRGAGGRGARVWGGV